MSALPTAYPIPEFLGCAAENDDERLPLDALFSKPEGETALSLQDMRALLKASPSELTFPDSYEWKSESVQLQFRAVTKDMQTLFLQVPMPHLTLDMLQC